MRRSLLLASALAIASPAVQAANTYTTVWDGTLAAEWEGNDYDGYFTSTMVLGGSRPDGWSRGGMELPNLSVNFTTDKTFSVILSAPTGQKFTINPPTTPLGASNTQSRLDIHLGNALVYTGESFGSAAPAYTFEGLEGSVSYASQFSYLNYSSSTYYPEGSPTFFIDALFYFDGPISFTSLKLDFVSPSNNTISGTFISEALITARWQGDFDPFAEFGPAPAQPANWVSLTPVPEPSTYGLALGGLALAVVAMRRRAKK